MKYPENELAQMVIASCVANHIHEVVISPGSRNAPLTIGFSQVSTINTYSIVDERCAAFVALGMAQKTKKPTVVSCTSGSALLNYYPAVAEAFYGNIPLIVISADRPKEMIDIGDGQTIRQEGVFKNHILFEANLTAIQNEVDRAYNKKLLFKAISVANKQKGPVHINVPFDEPLYNLVDDLLSYPLVEQQEEQLLQEKALEVKELEPYAEIWNKATKKIVLLGVSQPSKLLQTQINHLLKDPSVLVLTETTSNINNEGVINSIDQFLAGLTEEEKSFYQPEVLLTIGGLVVSKKIKQYLRAFKPKHHFAVHPTFGYDTFQCLTKYFKISTELFFSQFFWLTKPVESNYQAQGLAVKKSRKIAHQKYADATKYSDFKVFDLVNKSLPLQSVLQLSNSATVRYAQLFDINDDIAVFCNRGTSGIDGSTSTAIGSAMKTQKQVTLVTGDLSFLYDSNALWSQYIPANFRIVIVNNSGGGIFKILPGPKQTNALSYFETPHDYTAEHLAKMYGFEYVKATDLDSTKKGLETFYNESKQPKILEVFTPSNSNDEVLRTYFEKFKA
ncbi:2-succinyl-5-enolpyruvyl-6-hydroxy-3-cyclohexene-1-carboxylate synthase [Wenyingzhuangia fucanilytica]|uniref:2-succinyl-5-enolpyruvyl-6-hydroxy-3-cyclohexene-1-carboxylate synthase n=1 Tax=Wenyingzhuangia fucanilytica TaxID=1790137 RepID=A0A1B1Y742_9FLAO|nr:2-succinyl-5-enolpyruvyl-6-hydroxy-3-cyclohexene-1-carboxylic-acid synthase [Wenyingzhuangia fucanilytica]ANW96586.1 2-succinyl-5-enolpyruvyl-6-hydroxy-3-cyclohexene-1-carboxylate synthase [Wenyingzhuangia fucanilytica]